jgi:hypothetical protein
MHHTTDRTETVIDALTSQFRDALREWAKKANGSDTITLYEMEQDVRAGLHALGEKVMQGLVDMVGTGKTEAPVFCPECEKKMTFVRYQGKWVETLLGTIQPERAYFHCAECGQGYVPLDHQLGLGADSLSAGLEEAICLLATHMPLEQVADQLKRLMLVDIDDNTIQRAVIRVGSAMVDHQKQDGEQAWQESEPPQMEVDEPPKRLYISADGTKIHLRSGWREVKAAAIYETKATVKSDGTTEIRAMNITYVISFEPVEAFARYVYLEAARRGIEEAEEVVVLGDGADWIWNHIADLCDKPVEILDFYHASKHLEDAAKALHGEDTPEAEEWTEQRCQELLEEGPDEMLASLWQAAGEASGEVKKAVIKEIQYFTKRKHLMHYPELRAAGYHIGSGSVESACKRLIGARLKQGGMIWSREGAQAMAHVRTKVLSNRWDPFWTGYDRATQTYQRAA